MTKFVIFTAVLKLKMSSLVADYSSEEDSEPEVNDVQPNPDVSLENDAANKPGRNFLVSDVQDNSDSSDDDSKNITSTKNSNELHGNIEKLPNPLAEKLPSPHLGSKTKKCEASVFTNPFEQAEMAKQSVLEKHVKMTEKNIPKNVKFCWKFKKGKCPFGKGCKYSHDLETTVVGKPQEDVNEGGVPDEPNSVHTQNPNYHGRTFSPHIQQHSAVPKQGFRGTLDTLKPHGKPSYGRAQKFSPIEEVDCDNYMANAKRKKRGGVSDTLQPAKKSMGALQRQREMERPWTVQK